MEPGRGHAEGGRGRVVLVGAGPGDPALITRRGLDALRSCDVVVYDRLVAPELVAEAPPHAERIYAGKAPGKTTSQDAINDLLVDRARAGAAVVRLKGGDPFVFGRGAEEALALAAAGIPWEVVPGVSAAFGVPAAAAIPVTHRGVAASVAVVAARRGATGATDTDWDALARGADTLVVLMGVEALPEVVANLLDAGRDPAQGACLIERGATIFQRSVMGALRDIAGAAAEAGIEPPATLVVGDVVGIRSTLASGELTAPPIFSES